MGQYEVQHNSKWMISTAKGMLAINDRPHKNKNRARLDDQYYRMPSGWNTEKMQTYLGGALAFRLKEIEVYRVHLLSAGEIQMQQMAMSHAMLAGGPHRTPKAKRSSVY